jgi:hypothetical protein
VSIPLGDFAEKFLHLNIDEVLPLDVDTPSDCRRVLTDLDGI